MTTYKAQPDAPHRAGKYTDNAFTALINHREAGQRGLAEHCI